jgi:hypothetical protein
MSSTSGRHAREFYGADQNDETATTHGEVASNPIGTAVSFTIDEDEVEMGDGATTVITATVQHGGVDKSGVVLTATSDDTDVATVTASDTTDANGEATFTVTGVAGGECGVSIAYGALKLNRAVAVEITDVTFTRAPTTVSVVALATDDVTATVLHDDEAFEGAELTATSSDTDVATVTATDTTDASGEATFTITGVAAGTCDVTIAYAAMKLSVTVGVTVTTE